MKQNITALLTLVLLASAPLSHAIVPLAADTMDDSHTFRVEVLQVTDIEPYQQSMTGFLDALKDSGIVDGKNLELHRAKIDFDVENGGFWSKLGVLMRIRQEAARIVAAKPDLVLTIGTPATKYARGMFEDAHIPMVFTAVANPEDAGCGSLLECGPGVTGSTLYTDMDDTMRVVRQIFPHVQRIGMVHTDDENGVANVAAAGASARPLGMTVSARLVAKNDSILPALRELYAGGSGVQMFAVPLDTYYGLHRYEAASDLSDFGTEFQIPVVTLAMVRVPGAVLYVGADFTNIGSMAGMQAARILKRRVDADTLPIRRQQVPTVLIDPARAAALHVDLPDAIAERKIASKNGLWQIDWAR